MLITPPNIDRDFICRHGRSGTSVVGNSTKGESKVPPATMIRTVVTEGDTEYKKNGLPNVQDDYKTKLLKYIPAETVAFFTALVGVVESLRTTNPNWYIVGLAIVFLAGFVGTPLYLIRIYGMKWQYKKGQIIVSTIAYVLWVLALGAFQDFIPIPDVIVTLALGVFTFFVAPFIDPGVNTSTQPT